MAPRQSTEDRVVHKVAAELRYAIHPVSVTQVKRTIKGGKLPHAGSRGAIISSLVAYGYPFRSLPAICTDESDLEIDKPRVMIFGVQQPDCFADPEPPGLLMTGFAGIGKGLMLLPIILDPQEDEEIVITLHKRKRRIKK